MKHVKAMAAVLMAAALILGAFVAVRAVDVVGDIEYGYEYEENGWLWDDSMFPSLSMPFGRAVGVVVE
jgi:hypothetical protein